MVSAMAIGRAVLLIADIGGYTRFMSVHRINLAHAQDVVAQLLEAVIDGAQGFKLAKLEGDAAFFYAPVGSGGGDARGLGDRVTRIRRAFADRQRELEENRLCSCDGCVQAKQLTLKFVAHVGEVAEQKVKGHRELAGVSVITVHRLLKNDVPVPEYVLMTDELFREVDDALGPDATRLESDLEGLGATTLHYVDLAARDLALPPPGEGSFWRKFRAWLGLTWRSLPYFVGAKTSCEAFRNLGAIGEGAPAALPDGPARS